MITKCPHGCDDVCRDVAAATGEPVDEVHRQLEREVRVAANSRSGHRWPARRDEADEVADQ